MPDRARWKVLLAFITKQPPSSSLVLLFLTDMTLIWGISCFSLRHSILVMSLLSTCSSSRLSIKSSGILPTSALLLMWIIWIRGSLHSIIGASPVILLLLRSMCLSRGSFRIGSCYSKLELSMRVSNRGSADISRLFMLVSLLKPIVIYSNRGNDSLGRGPLNWLADKSTDLRLLSSQRDTLMASVRRFWERSSLRREGNPLMMGIPPEILLQLRLSYCKAGRLHFARPDSPSILLSSSRIASMLGRLRSGSSPQRRLLNP